MSLYVRTLIPNVLSKLAERTHTVSQYPAWSRFRRSTDVPRADHDRVGWSPWQGGFKEHDTMHAIPFLFDFFDILKCSQRFCFQAQKDHRCDRLFLGQTQFVTAFNNPKPKGYTLQKTETTGMPLKGKFAP